MSELAEQVDRELSARPGRPVRRRSWTAIALTLPDPSGPPVRVPVRCLFALSGLGLLDGTDSTGPSGSRPPGPGCGWTRRWGRWSGAAGVLPLLV